MNKSVIKELVRQQITESVMPQQKQKEEQLDESLLALGAIAIAGVTVGLGKMAQARKDRVMAKVMDDFKAKIMPKFDEMAKRVERMTKLVSSASDYDKIVSEIDALGSYVESAKTQSQRIDIESVISEEAKRQWFMKWGGKRQDVMKKMVQKELEKTIEDLETAKKNMMFNLELKIDQM
jgi:endonuclease I